MQHVFIIGSKGIPGGYGGYETFVDKLTEYHQYHSNIKYHVACKSTEEGEYEYHNARCFKIRVPDIGPSQAIYYDVKALKQCLKYIKENNIKHPILYVLACRIGPFAAYFHEAIHKLGGVLYVNPDGHEWKRTKWSIPVRKYWKLSEKLMVKNSDLLICDSKNIENYIIKEYAEYHPNTMFIAYGAETKSAALSDDNEHYIQWMTDKGLAPREFYLVVGRFVPENNCGIMIREFMHANTKRDFVLITNASGKFLTEIKKITGYEKDPRIKFVGTVYDQELLKKIRENAYGYLHGHEVGGTNPSLLEGLGSTNLNLLLDVGFNREVAEDTALYWSKEEGSLAALIEKVESLSANEIFQRGVMTKRRITEAYSWEHIVKSYENVFLREL